jgi:CYTH domain-containing protein
MKLVWTNACKVENIHQFYLNSKKGYTHRLRSLQKFGGDKVKYLYTIKKNISPGVNEEDEKYISKDEYWNLAENADKTKAPISKTRYTFNYSNQLFELDVFEKELEGLIVLEIELNDMGDRVHLPPYLTNVKEVTKLKSYRNSYMAKLALKFDNAGKMLGAV